MSGLRNTNSVVNVVVSSVQCCGWCLVDGETETCKALVLLMSCFKPDFVTRKSLSFCRETANNIPRKWQLRLPWNIKICVRLAFSLIVKKLPDLSTIEIDIDIDMDMMMTSVEGILINRLIDSVVSLLTNEIQWRLITNQCVLIIVWWYDVRQMQSRIIIH